MMKDNYDFSKGRKNPYAERLEKYGHAVVIHYAPGEPIEDEATALEEYNKSKRQPDDVPPKKQA